MVDDPWTAFQKTQDELSEAFRAIIQPAFDAMTEIVIPNALAERPDGTLKSIGEVRIPLIRPRQ